MWNLRSRFRVLVFTIYFAHYYLFVRDCSRMFVMFIFLDLLFYTSMLRFFRFYDLFCSLLRICSRMFVMFIFCGTFVHFYSILILRFSFIPILIYEQNYKTKRSINNKFMSLNLWILHAHRNKCSECSTVLLYVLLTIFRNNSASHVSYVLQLYDSSYILLTMGE